MAIFKNYFYHDLTRKYQLTFGSLFQDLQVKRWHEDGRVKDMIGLSVLHAPKEKFIYRLTEDIDKSNTSNKGRRRTAMTVPALSYEMTDMAYDGQRKISKNMYMKRQNENITLGDKVYTPVPYTLTFEVNIVAGTQSEMNQIIEQIIPGFQPDYTVTVKALDNIIFDIPITFTGLFRNDNWSGAIEARREIMYTLNFTMKTYYFSPINSRAIILDVTADIFNLENDESRPTLIERFTAHGLDEKTGEWEGEWHKDDKK